MAVFNALVWGIKSSWVEYIFRMGDGAVAMSGGVERLDTGEFVFPVRDVTDQAVTFTGEVAFSGHFGMLSVRFVDLAITNVDGVRELSIAEDDPQMRAERRTILTLDDPHRRGAVWEFSAPTLTSLGADLFFDNYRAGTRFDPVFVPAHAIDAPHPSSLEEV